MRCPNCNCEIEFAGIVAGGGGPSDKWDENAGTGKTPDKLKWGKQTSSLTGGDYFRYQYQEAPPCPPISAMLALQERATLQPYLQGYREGMLFRMEQVAGRHTVWKGEGE